MTRTVAIFTTFTHADIIDKGSLYYAWIILQADLWNEILWAPNYMYKMKGSNNSGLTPKNEISILQRHNVVKTTLV